MGVRIMVYTCDDYSWTLPGLSYLLGTYWSWEQPVVYAGCAKREDLPPSWEWMKVESRVKERWSDGLIEMLRMLPDTVALWLLDDYYLCRNADNAAIDSLAEYMEDHPDILRIDLTADRLYSGHAVDVDTYGHVDLVETDWETPYQFSTQAALWNRKHLLSLLKPEMSPWDFELRGDHFPTLRVLGTRQWLLRYTNFLGMGLGKGEYRTEHIRHGLGGTTIERIPAEHVQFMQEHGLIPADKTCNNTVNR